MTAPRGGSSRTRTRTRPIACPAASGIRGAMAHPPRFRGHRRRSGRAAAHPGLLHTAGADRGATLRHQRDDRVSTFCSRARCRRLSMRTALGARPHRPDRQPVGDRLRRCPPPRCSGRHAPPIRTAPGTTSPPAPAPITSNYTTAATALADNGTQYRVVATNAVGSVAERARSQSRSAISTSRRRSRRSPRA